MGIVSPVGNRLDEAWRNVLEGNSGIRTVQDFDISTYATQIAGEVRDFDPADYFAPKDIRSVAGTETMTLRGHTLPLCRLDRVFGLDIGIAADG